ncbi:MAG: GIY-YIG nuclease family protein [Acetobacteraceae bacterium]
MANDPFTIRIFVPDGDPEGVRLIDRMNWTGLGIVVPREKWLATRQRGEFSLTGVYILAGQTEGNELPTVYVGEARGIRTRIDAHFQNKDFWDRAIVFTASNNSLNTAHAKWLEYALVERGIAGQAQHSRQRDRATRAGIERG